MVSPTRSPPAGEARSPPPPPQHTAVDPSPPRSPENLAPTPPDPAAPAPAPPPVPAPLTPPAPPPPNRSGDSSPPLPSHNQAPSQPSSDPSPLPPEKHSPAQRPAHPSAPAPTPPSPPAAESLEANSEPEADEEAGDLGNMTLAHALTQDEEAAPPKEAAMAESPLGSPQESTLTIAKLLSGEDPAATDAKPAADKVAPAVVTGPVSATGGGGGWGGGGVRAKRWLLGGVPNKVRRAELRRAELGFRVSAAVFCLVSLSVMATDTTPGWSGDSFGRYNEYRYTLATSVMAFTYSGFQLVAEVYRLVTQRRIIRGLWGNYFNLAMDQVLAYLLLSASSAALSRNDVWVSRFGVDQFARLINASASMAFLAFIALGLSSIISAYHVFSSVSLT